MLSMNLSGSVKGTFFRTASQYECITKRHISEGLDQLPAAASIVSRSSLLIRKLRRVSRGRRLLRVCFGILCTP